jgi:crossover junction endodeoxyribonuclease RuvC
MTRVLGVDASLRCTGFGIVDTDGRTFEAVDCGLIRTPAKAPLSECLRRLSGGIRELVESYAPDVASVEGAFFFKNARTAMILGMARGAVIAALAERAIPVFEYAPRRAKQAVCGYGNASKEQVSHLVAQLLGLDVRAIPADATDALALAICHAQATSALHGLLAPRPV